jgi:hypothetical protein
MYTKHADSTHFKHNAVNKNSQQLKESCPQLTGIDPACMDTNEIAI